MRLVRATGLAGLALTLAMGLLFILFAIVYFMVSIWIIKIGAGWAGYKNIEAGWVILTAGIITAGIMIGSNARNG